MTWWHDDMMTWWHDAMMTCWKFLYPCTRTFPLWKLSFLVASPPKIQIYDMMTWWHVENFCVPARALSLFENCHFWSHRPPKFLTIFSTCRSRPSLPRRLHPNGSFGQRPEGPHRPKLKDHRRPIPSHFLVCRKNCFANRDCSPNLPFPLHLLGLVG